MEIAYLLESTGLCGGVKVVFRQAEKLLIKGHRAVVISTEGYPSWFKGRVLFQQDNLSDLTFLHRFDRVIATSWQILLRLYEVTAVRKKLWHLVQGYEGDYVEAESCMETIEHAYSLPVPKVTVSTSLAQRLNKIYPKRKFISAGQGLEDQYFFPPDDLWTRKGSVISIFLVGPLSISIKQISSGLRAFALARKRIPELKLVRISAIDTRSEEESMVGHIKDYYVHLTPEQVGHVFRSTRGIFLSPSGPGEGFGLPALEAMACGVPAVLTRIPAYMSFTSPCNYALFTPYDDENAMSAVLCSLVENQEEQRRLTRRGLEVASLFSYEMVAANLEEILLNG